MKNRVVILGGGVGGLSAAHELAHRGFQVEVFERLDIPGGKARSTGEPGTGKNEDLPGEHGFRFFPGFYRHLPDTMSRIDPPITNRFKTTAEMAIAPNTGRAPLVLPTPLSSSPIDLMRKLPNIFSPEWQISPEDQAHFCGLFLQYLSSCDERRYGEYECMSWLDFSDANNPSRLPGYKKYCVEGLTRTLVAAKASQMSARTAVSILFQLLFDMATPGTQVDRVLGGPTNDVWIDPWLSYLRRANVPGLKPIVYNQDTSVIGISCSGNGVNSITVNNNGVQRQVTGDWYVAAMPVEEIRSLLGPVAVLDPSLNALNNLKVAWMNGIQIYLSQPIHTTRGHTIYAESKWALTSIAQKQFWPEVDLSKYGNGTVKDILSVDISEWQTPDDTGVGKTADACTPDEIYRAVIGQLEAHLNVSGIVLNRNDVVGYHLDPDIFYIPLLIPPHVIYAVPANFEPLLINTMDSWSSRPEATTSLDNFFLAADYVRTYTDLATMEAANEAARRAVNAILEKSGSAEARCRIFPLQEPSVFAPLRELDRLRYQRKLPFWKQSISMARGLLPLWQATYALQSLRFRLQATISSRFRSQRLGPATQLDVWRTRG